MFPEQYSANSRYWAGKPPIERIEMPVLLNPETEYNNFITAKLDMAGAELTRYVQDKAANRLAPLETQLAWLREIGFRDVDCYWKQFELAVMAGYK